MGDSYKTIKINPATFFGTPKGDKSKTRRRNTTNSKIIPRNTINNLKNKMQKRLIAHKKNETQITPSISPSFGEKENEKTDTIGGGGGDDDEFGRSIKYFTSLNNKKCRTLKNVTHRSPPVAASLEVPPGLQDNSNNSHITPKYKVDTELPYGCLKGGAKQCYRDWNQTRKRYERNVFETTDEGNDRETINPNARPPTPPKRNSTNTNSELSDNTNVRLAKVKEKLAAIQERHNRISNNNNNNNIISNTKIVGKNRKRLKRTIRHHYNLGKSSKNRKVGILLKNDKTRKNVIQAQCEIKNTPITDIYKYLQIRGIIKSGTTAPNDVMRKMFEMSMLTGDVRNTNGETLIHNFK